MEKPLICIDTNNPNQTHAIDFAESGIYHNLIFNEDVYPKDHPALMLYSPGM